MWLGDARSMLDRTTVRTVAALVTALCVVTMFAGSAAAIDLGAVSVDDSGDDAAVEIDTGLDTEGSQSGGGGSGSVSVDTAEGGAEGSGAAAVDAEDQSVSVAAAGEGGPDGNEQGGSVDCTFDQESVQNPQEACDYDAPGGDGLPEPPTDELPDDELPELPGGDIPVDPGAGVPLDGLQVV